MPGRPQHPDQTRGDHAAGIVVGDHRVLVADSELAHPPGEVGGLGQRVSTLGGIRGAGEAGLEIDEHRPGQVRRLVGSSPRAAVQVPADVGQQAIGAMALQPGGVDDRVHAA